MEQIKMPDYYLSHGIITDPGKHAAKFDVFRGCSIKEIVDAIQGLFLHIFWAGSYGVTLTEEQKRMVQSRKVSTILDVIAGIDDSPLNIARPLDKRFIGNCRDHSVFLCSILRTVGIPARARCGFGTYFIPNHYEDHWMCEYWDGTEKRWVRGDPQLDELQKNKLNIAFDTLDMPAGQFVTGDHAWKLCRTGAANPDDFGIFDMKGLWFVRGNLIRDIASCNKMELLPWDGWGLMEKGEEAQTKEDFALLDKAADLLIAGDMAIYELYGKEPGLRMSGKVKSYVPPDFPEVVIE